MIEVFSQSIEATEASLTAITDCNITSESILDMQEMINSIFESSENKKELSTKIEEPSYSFNNSVSKLESRTSYIKDSHLFETDDLGNIYRCDGHLISGVEYYDNGWKYRVNESGAVEVLEEGYYSSRKERLDRTPVDGERGKWEGEPGESKYKPLPITERGVKVLDRLSEYGLDGIEYKNALPDFSPCCIESVEIDMTEVRYLKGGNFEKADTMCANKWNEMQFKGCDTWTARSVAEYRLKHNFTWHECEDRKTCQMVSRDIHDYFGHSGGVSECKKRLGKTEGGGFDD